MLTPWRYSDFEGPETTRVGTVFPASLTVKNAGWRPWRSDDPTGAVFASYHWLGVDGEMAIEDGRRTPLPRPLAPGESLAMTVTVEAPPAAGRYTLAFDLVEEGVTWFSEAGAPMLRVAVSCRPA